MSEFAASKPAPQATDGVIIIRLHWDELGRSVDRPSSYDAPNVNRGFATLSVCAYSSLDDKGMAPVGTMPARRQATCESGSVCQWSHRVCGLFLVRDERGWRETLKMLHVPARC